MSKHNPKKKFDYVKMERILDYYYAMEKPQYKEALIKGGGYKESTANRLTGAYFRQPEVAAEMQARREIMLQEAGITKDALIEQLKKIAFGSMAKFITVTEDGELNYDFSDATLEDKKLIKELQVDSYKDGRGQDARIVKKFKFTLPDQLRAIEMLGRMIGAFVDKVEHSGQVDIIERLQRGRKQVKDG